MTTKKNVFLEAVKEPLRLLALAVLPFGVAYLKDLPYEWAGVTVVILRTFDRFLHEYGKATKSPKLIKGLTRF